MYKFVAGHAVALIMGAVIMCGALGIIMIAVAGSLPVYKDEAKYYATEQTLYNEEESAFGAGDHADEDAAFNKLSDEWYALRDSELTSKYGLLDHGYSFIALGASTLFGLALYVALSRPGRSPSRAYFFVTANVAAVAAGGLSIVQTEIDFDRGTYPPWGDSLGIPLFGIVLSFLLFTPLLNVFFGILPSLRYKKGLPLGIRSVDHPERSRRKHRVAAGCLVIPFGLLVLETANGDYAGVPILVLLTAGMSVRFLTAVPKPIRPVSPSSSVSP